MRNLTAEEAAQLVQGAPGMPFVTIAHDPRALAIVAQLERIGLMRECLCGNSILSETTPRGLRALRIYRMVLAGEGMVRA